MKLYFVKLCGLYLAIWIILFLATALDIFEAKTISAGLLTGLITSLITFYPMGAISVFYRKQMNRNIWLSGLTISVMAGIVLTVWLAFELVTKNFGGYVGLVQMIGGVVTGMSGACFVTALACINNRQMNLTRVFGYLTFAILALAPLSTLAETALKIEGLFQIPDFIPAIIIAAITGIIALLLSVLLGLKK